MGSEKNLEYNVRRLQAARLRMCDPGAFEQGDGQLELVREMTGPGP
jgi:hypothetical protein